MELPGGYGTAFLGNPDVSFPLVSPVAGAEGSTRFRSLDLGRVVLASGAFVGISKPAVSDAAGFGFQLGRVAVAAASDGREDSVGADDPAACPLLGFVESALAVFWSPVAVELLVLVPAVWPAADAGSDSVGELVPVDEVDAPAVGVPPPTNPVSNAQASPATSTAAAKTATIQYFVFMHSPSVTCPRG